MAAIGWNPKSFRGRHSQSGGRGSLGALGALDGESWCPPYPPLKAVESKATYSESEPLA